MADAMNKNIPETILSLTALACLVILLFIHGRKINELEDAIAELVMHKIRVECNCGE